MVNKVKIGLLLAFGVLLNVSPMKAQGKVLEFVGYLFIKDTVQFNQTNTYYSTANDTLLIVVPAGELWYLNKTVCNYDRNNSNRPFSNSTSVCNCLKIDDMTLINLMNTDDFGTTALNGGRVYSSINYSTWELRKLSLFCNERIPLESGIHELIFEAIIYGNNNSSYGGYPIISINAFIEKYSIQ